MSLRHTSRRPNRRQLDTSATNVAPVALRWTAPGHNGANTVFEGALTLTNCRVTSQAATPEVERITCDGWFDGTWQTVPALEVGNEGEDTSGTRLQITFVGLLDLDAPWSLNIPADCALIGGPNGGKLTGTYQEGQPVDSNPGGYVRQTSLDDVAPAFPPLSWPISMTATGPNTLSVDMSGGGAGSFDVTGVPALLIDGMMTAVSVTDAGGGVLDVVSSALVALGATLDWPAWSPLVRPDTGGYVVPFHLVAT